MLFLRRFGMGAIFLKKMNPRRSGNEMSNDVFDFFKEIFSFILKKMEKKTDFNIFLNLLLLSQTFYCNKDGNKVYLENEIKNEKIFKTKNFWKKFLKHQIEEDLNIFLKNEINYDKKELKKKKIQLLLVT